MFTHSIEKAKNFVIVVAVRNCVLGRSKKKSPLGYGTRRKELQGGTPLHEMVDHLMSH